MKDDPYLHHTQAHKTKQSLQPKPIPASFSNMQVLRLNPTFV